MLAEEDDRGSLEKKQEELYARGGIAHHVIRKVFTPHHSNSAHTWKKDSFTIPPKPHKHVRFAVLFFWISFIFFLVAGGVSAYLLFSGTRSVSTNRVIVTIQGPTSIAGGDTVPLLITITNRNTAPLTNATLLISFPPGTRSADNLLASFTRYSKKIGTIAPGATVKRQVKAVLFGGQGDVLPIHASIQFQTSGSNATFTKKASNSISIISTPLSVSIAAPASVVSGQSISIIATIRSNSTKPISGVVLHMTYPAGFTIIKSSPYATAGNFFIGTLTPNQTKIVKISGILIGQIGTQQSFKFSVGTAITASSGSIAVAYMTQTATIAFTQPFIATILTINNGSVNTTTLMPGTTSNISVAWTNTLTVPITNARIAVVVGGNALDRSSIKSTNGKYQSANHTIVFSRDTNPSLANLPPGAQGTGTFTFNTLPVASTTVGNIYHPIVTLSTLVAGEYPGQSTTIGTTTTSSIQKIKIGTLLTLHTYVLHAKGPFANTGPIPPVANIPTTYTIVWSVHNTLNDVGGATISANLPTDVQFVGHVSSNYGAVTYNKGTHAVSWSIGNISSNTTRTAMFQVSITPSTNEKGTAPILLNTTTGTAFDRFAQINVSTIANSVTTYLTHNPQYGINSGIVQ